MSKLTKKQAAIAAELCKLAIADHIAKKPSRRDPIVQSTPFDDLVSIVDALEAFAKGEK